MMNEKAAKLRTVGALEFQILEGQAIADNTEKSELSIRKCGKADCDKCRVYSMALMELIYIEDGIKYWYQ
jgi:hypothetical protein